MNSNSLKVLWFILPLFLVAAFVVIINPQGSKFWLSISHHHYLETLNNGSSTKAINEKDEVPIINVNKNTETPKRLSKIEKLEAGLARSRAAILLLRQNKSNHIEEEEEDEYIPHGPMYLNATSFHRSYLEMEKKFKVYVYKEGDPPLYHFGPCKHTYAIEGYFIQAMEVSKFRTENPNKAHVYFLPLSVTMLIEFIYVAESHEWGLMKNTTMDYVNVISQKYPYWNRSLGADHFMLACHDWGPEISFAIPHLYKNSIRALCNANTSEKFNPTKDVSIPEIHLPLGTTKGLLGGPPPSDRPVLVFFAGGVHGPIRPILLQHWENSKDEDVQIHKYLPKGVSYYDMIRKSKYCLCPSGYEVASPRMVEGLYMGCVPVLIKDNYVTPFSDVLDWDTFVVTIHVKDIPNLKKILMDIPQDKYLVMQKRGIQMRRHFEVNSPPKRYDVFHMILHSIWIRRLNFRVHDVDES
ncbi:probable glycosyltransferase At5g03795 [Solanum stenotomum]|uniref:probable glycosyltransferase At5g03795 n=1 Tax=Solanum stenotomum TaxID=172797 RepID=UPI0020D09677|nr:probable glycosyltransferase At5g03795 [Solanum stenotomum]